MQKALIWREPSRFTSHCHCVARSLKRGANGMMRPAIARRRACASRARSGAKPLLALIKQREHEGYEYEAAPASLALLIRGALEHKRDLLFTVDMYHVSMRRDARDSICEATVKVRVGSTVHHTVAEGDGPVNALDGALRAALIRSFPQLSKVMLTDYKVRILNAGAGTAAKTRVLIESTDGRREWGTVGVSENIIEASLQALADSIEYALLRR